MKAFQRNTGKSFFKNDVGVILIIWILASLVYNAVCASVIIKSRTKLVTNRTEHEPSKTYDVSISTTKEKEPTKTIKASSQDIAIGPCTWVIGRTCPDEDIKFYLYTRKNVIDRQYLQIDESLEKSNLTSSFFNVRHPTKIIIHGYNSDMFLNPLQMMREEYLAKAEYNLIYVDWSILSPGPCYISAVHNTRHTGACVAQLVERILEYGSADIHVIGFSLGAQLSNYIARNLGSFLLPRITGLDPAMPLFITASVNDKLDSTDAAYVDVIHTNAMVQGKLERCGHVDFYMNGGIFQPGCSSQGQNPSACSHQRAPAYFLESIRSQKGFWGWSCSSYIAYLLGMCPPTNYLLEAGENVRHTTKGMFIVTTNDTAPYALGKWTDLPTLGAVKRPWTLGPPQIFTTTISSNTYNTDPLLRQIDEWGKLDSNFNNLNHSPTPYSQDPYGDNWTYFGKTGTKEITETMKKKAKWGEETDSENSVEEQSLEVQVEPNNSMKNNEKFQWSEYRHNLTQGFIDNSIFSLPEIRYYS